MVTYNNMYDRILVPTDGSTGVEQAVDHAVGLATAHDATIHAVYVVNVASFGGLPMETSWEGVGTVLREEGQEAVEHVRKLANEAGVRVETDVVEGSPSRGIVRYADQNECDLIVMGTHGRGGLDRLLLGSVTERVVRTSDVPVLTVRMTETVTPPEEAGSEAVTEPAEREA